MVKDLCFEIIEACLNNCLFCSSNSNCSKKQIVKYEDFKRVIDYFMNNGGITELSLSGGEPFLHPDIIKMVSYAKSLGIKTVIFTSGVTKNNSLPLEEREKKIYEMNNRLSEIEESEPENDFLKQKIIDYYNMLLNPSDISSIPKELLNELNKLGLDKLVFDYQAYEYETDHKLMGRKEEYRISLLKSLITSSMIGLDVEVHFVPMKLNYKEIEDIIEMLEIAEVKKISILNFLPQGRGKTNEELLQLSDLEYGEFFELLEKSKKNYSGEVRIGIPLQKENSHKCNAGLEKLDIRYDGIVLPCPAFKEITLEECQKFNIKLPNIYENLEDVIIPGEGTRVNPLCKQIYSFRNKR